MLFLFVLGAFLNLLELRVHSMRYDDIAIQSYERVVLIDAHLDFKPALLLTRVPRNVQSPQEARGRYSNRSFPDL
jgi:hypothetical protein